MMNRLAKALLLVVPLGGCPCPDGGMRVDTTAAREMFATQIDACLKSDDACEALCRAVLALPMDSVVTRCTITSARPDDVSLTAMFYEPHQCIGGRRPDGFVEPRCAPWVARAAMLEGASITAFARLVRALEHHGAPPALIAEARRAIADEALHAQLCARLAAQLGATVPEVVVEPRDLPTLEQLAIENAVEGEVGETFGALIAACQARTAADPDVRAVCAILAVDEARHAQLAHELGAWLATRLSPGARAEVAMRKRRAIAELLDASDPLDTDARMLLGVPPLAEAARALFA